MEGYFCIRWKPINGGPTHITGPNSVDLSTCTAELMTARGVRIRSLRYFPEIKSTTNFWEKWEKIGKPIIDTLSIIGDLSIIPEDAVFDIDQSGIDGINNENTKFTIYKVDFFQDFPPIQIIPKVYRIGVNIHSDRDIPFSDVAINCSKLAVYTYEHYRTFPKDVFKHIFGFKILRIDSVLFAQICKSNPPDIDVLTINAVSDFVMDASLLWCDLKKIKLVTYGLGQTPKITVKNHPTVVVSEYKYVSGEPEHESIARLTGYTKRFRYTKRADNG